MNLFPLPLVPFEEYMLLDDQPAHPMNFHLRLGFRGSLDPAILMAAAERTVRRHPLLTAVVGEADRGGLQWVPGSQDEVSVKWLGGARGEHPPHTPPLDLRREPGLRFWATEGAAGTDLLLQFHHACCDGLGSIGFARDLLLEYARGVLPARHRSAVRVPSLDANRLRGRGDFGLTPQEAEDWMQQKSRAAAAARDFLTRPVASLTPPSPAEDVPLATSYPAVCSRTLSASETAGLRRLSREQEVTVNDLLLRDLLLTIGNWRERQGFEDDASWLRLMVPVNLRSALDQSLPAANVVSMAFLDRRPGDLRRPQRLLRGIHHEMQIIKQERLALAFVLWLAALKNQLGEIARGDSRATCVLTNLGAVLDEVPLPRDRGRLVVGDTLLDSVQLYAPWRLRTSIALAVLQYAGRLNLTLHYDPRVLEAGSAEELFDEFVAQVRSSTASVFSAHQRPLALMPVGGEAEATAEVNDYA